VTPLFHTQKQSLNAQAYTSKTKAHMSSFLKTGAAPLCILLILSCAAYLYTARTVGDADIDETHANNDSHENPIENSEPIELANAHQLPYQSAHGHLVPSLKGIYFDRDLAIDDDGNLRVSSDVKDIFDFFFSAIEEEDLDVVLARINEYLAYKLEQPALAQAKSLLADYVAYKAALFDLEQSYSAQISEFTAHGQVGVLDGAYLQLIEQRLSDVSSLRAKHLTQEAYQAFYSEKEQYDQYMLRKLAINADSTLTQDQKDHAYQALDSEMPEAFIASRDAANPVTKLRQATQSVDVSNKAQLHQARRALVGEEAATRLSELDQQRADWKMRYDSYARQRDLIINNSGISSEIVQDEINTLRSSLFNSSELTRVMALDQIDLSKAL